MPLLGLHGVQPRDALLEGLARGELLRKLPGLLLLLLDLGNLRDWMRYIILASLKTVELH